MNNIIKREVSIAIGPSFINGDLHLVEHSKMVVIFAHGSGSSRLSTRNRFVAEILQKANLSTFLFDLLTPEEDAVDVQTREFRFDIPLLAKRLILVTEWIQKEEITSKLHIGYFGSSTGAAAALIAAGELTTQINAVVSRGGRPDLAKDYLPSVTAPTLLIVGALDYEVIQLNEFAYNLLTCEKKLELVPDATHLFEEGNTLEQAAQLAADWFKTYEG